MNLPRKIQAGSAARDAEDEAKARRSESFSPGGSGQGLRLSPRGSSAPPPQAVSREQYARHAEIQVSSPLGQPFEKKSPTPSEPPPAAAPAAAPAPAPGLLGSVVEWFQKLFRMK